LSDKHATKDNIITAEDEETIKEVATNLTFGAFLRLRRNEMLTQKVYHKAGGKSVSGWSLF